MSVLLRNLLHFGRLLRSLGLDVQAGRMLDVAGALEHIDIGRRTDFYFTLGALLVHRQQDLARGGLDHHRPVVAGVQRAELLHRHVRQLGCLDHVHVAGRVDHGEVGLVGHRL